MSKQRLQIPLLVIASICFSLLILEVVVRLFFPAHGKIVMINEYKDSERGKFARYDPLLGWDGLEGAEADFEWVDIRHHVKHNKYGYRGAEYALERSEKKRVMFFGDSFVWGFGVEQSEIFTTLLEEDTGGSVEVVNMGVSGFSTDQEFLLWKKKGKLWRPDEVVVAIVASHDILDNQRSVNYGYNKPLFKFSAGGELKLSNVPVPKKEGDWQTKTVKIETEKKRGKGLYWLSTHSAFVGLVVNAAAKSESFRAYLTRRGLLPGKRLKHKGSEDEHLRFLRSADGEVASICGCSLRYSRSLKRASKRQARA